MQSKPFLRADQRIKVTFELQIALEGNDQAHFMLIKTLDSSRKHFNKQHKVTTP